MNRNTTQEQVLHRDELYRRLPSVNDLLIAGEMQHVIESYGRLRTAEAIRQVISNLRNEISTGGISRGGLELELSGIIERIAENLGRGPRYSLRPVINATGVILHTNLGRAPLSEAAIAHIGEVARDYSNLEFDLETGERSKRDTHAEQLVLRALGIGNEDALRYGVVIVNNCAAATFLALNSLAEQREVVVSRGELIEIGGGFRIPEILEKSGAVLKEVGTTNRTRAADYELAVTDQTALLLRVHQSNFKIEGFVERPTLEELVSLAKTLGTPLFEDQGTGLIARLAQAEIADQPTLRASIAAGVDLVAASGDKLLGGPQCGILAGRADLIARIRKNPLLRTFRVDKLTYAALEATLLGLLSGQAESVPLIRMLQATPESIERRCRDVLASVQSTKLDAKVIEAASIVGGGTAPSARMRSYAVSLRHSSMCAEELLKQLRRCDPPVVARIVEDEVLLDLRTVPPQMDQALAGALNEL